MDTLFTELILILYGSQIVGVHHHSHCTTARQYTCPLVLASSQEQQSIRCLCPRTNHLQQYFVVAPTKTSGSTMLSLCRKLSRSMVLLWNKLHWNGPPGIIHVLRACLSNIAPERPGQRQAMLGTVSSQVFV